MRENNPCTNNRSQIEASSAEQHICGFKAGELFHLIADPNIREIQDKTGEDQDGCREQSPILSVHSNFKINNLFFLRIKGKLKINQNDRSIDRDAHNPDISGISFRSCDLVFENIHIK